MMTDSPIHFMRLLKFLEDKMGFTSEIEYIASFRGVVDMASFCLISTPFIVIHSIAEEVPSVVLLFILCTFISRHSTGVSMSRSTATVTSDLDTPLSTT